MKKKTILKDIKKGLKEIQKIKRGKDNSRDIEEFLKELQKENN